MSYPVGDVGRAVAHVDQNRDVAVAKVVHADPLYSRYLAASVHLIAEIFPGQPLEDPLIVRDMEEEPDVLFYLLSQWSFPVCIWKLAGVKITWHPFTAI